MTNQVVNSELLDLSALVCSKVCHDLINPIGAIANGLEVLEEEPDEDMRGHAMALIHSSAQQTSAKLQFARLAFGAGGAAGDHIELGMAKDVVDGIVDKKKVTLVWPDVSPAEPKDVIKLLLNIVALGLDCIPRGGTLTVSLEENPSSHSYKIAADGDRAKLADDVHRNLIRQHDVSSLDARSIRPQYAYLVAKMLGTKIDIQQAEENVTFAFDVRVG